MSDAIAELRTPEGRPLGYTVYQGSADMIAPEFWPTDDEAFQWCRRVGPGGNPWDRLDACEHEPTEAIVVSHYGGASHWPAAVCVECAVIHGRLSPYVLDYGYSGPTPEEAASDRAWVEAGWPRAGSPFAEGR